MEKYCFVKNAIQMFHLYMEIKYLKAIFWQILVE